MVNWNLVIIASFFFMFFIVSCIVVFIAMSRMRWNFKYVLFENVAGQGFIPTKRGKCRLISFGDGGEEVFLIQKSNKWRIAYGKRIGKNQVAWAVGDDGYWYNISFENLNKKLLEMGVLPVDRDMRYSYASVRKGIDKRYNTQNFMDKYGTLISFGMLLLCIIALGIVMWMTLDKQADIASGNVEALKVSKEVMELAKQVLSNVDNIKSGGSGLVPA